MFINIKMIKETQLIQNTETKILICITILKDSQKSKGIWDFRNKVMRIRKIISRYKGILIWPLEGSLINRKVKVQGSYYRFINDKIKILFILDFCKIRKIF